MDEGFYLFGEYRDEGFEVRHYICGDYHLWIWSDEAGSLARFEFRYKDWRIKYSGGEFSRGSENYIMPMFFILDQLFACDADVQARLLGIRDDYSPGMRAGDRSDAGEGPRPAIRVEG
jgi:hypothetical protein